MVIDRHLPKREVSRPQRTEIVFPNGQEHTDQPEAGLPPALKAQLYAYYSVQDVERLDEVARCRPGPDGQFATVVPAAFVTPKGLDTFGIKEYDWSCVRPEGLIIESTTYQRDQRDPLVEEIKAKPDPEMMDPLIVNVRTDGGAANVDGQNRSVGMIERGDGHRYLAARTWRALTLKQESELFNKRNDRRARQALSHQEWFNSGIWAGKQQNLAISTITSKLGIGIRKDRNPTAGQTYATKALMNLHTMYGADGDKRVEEILALLNDIMPNERLALSDKMIRGTNWFLRRVRELETLKPGIFDRKMLVKAFQDMDTKVHTGPQYRSRYDVFNIDWVQSLKGGIGSRPDKYIGLALRLVYNNKVRAQERRLDPWQDGDMKGEGNRRVRKK